MRSAALVLPFLLLACRQEPTFDERFEKAQHDINAKAAELDKELKPKLPPEPGAEDQSAKTSGTEAPSD